MPGTFFGPHSAAAENFAASITGNANLGRFPMGHTLITPDKREYRFALNDGTVEVAGNLYQSTISVANHIDATVDVARAVGAIVVSATLGATEAAVDLFAEGTVHTSNDAGEGYALRIARAFASGSAHAAAASSAVLTVNLSADSSVQVALTTGSEVSFTRNRYAQILIHPAPPTGNLAGVSPGVAAADRFYWSQTKGYAAVLANGTLLEGLPVMADITTNGAIENFKRRVRITGTTLAASLHAFGQLMDQDGSSSLIYIGVASTQTTVASAQFDIMGPITLHAPICGMCVQPNSTGQYALIDLKID